MDGNQHLISLAPITVYGNQSPQLPVTQIPSLNFKPTQLRTTAPTQAKPQVRIKTAPLQETPHGPLSPLPELESQLMPKLLHIQDTLSIEIDWSLEKLI